MLMVHSGALEHGSLALDAASPDCGCSLALATPHRGQPSARPGGAIHGAIVR
jgi:hypothetical protein